MELKVLSESERRNGGKKQQQYKLGKEVRLKGGEMCLKGENKVRGWGEHGG